MSVASISESDFESCETSSLALPNCSDSSQSKTSSLALSYCSDSSQSKTSSSALSYCSESSQSETTSSAFYNDDNCDLSCSSDCFYKDSVELAMRKEESSSGDDYIAEDSCYICLSRVREVDRFYPCNCVDSSVHRDCLRTWARVNRKCAKCLLVYAVERRNNCCPLCNRYSATKLSICRCKNSFAHLRCVTQKVALLDRCVCANCNFQFELQTRVLWNFRFDAFCNVLIFLFTTAAFGFLVAPFDIMRQFGATFPTHSALRGSSFLLFLGVELSGIYFVDVLYTVAFILAILGASLWVALYSQSLLRMRFRRGRLFFAGKNVMSLRWFCPILLLLTLGLHFCGNIHYWFYCGIGVIHSNGCYWRFNYQSFLASFAGLILVLGPFLLFYGCFRLFVAKKVVPVVVSRA